MFLRSLKQILTAFLTSIVLAAGPNCAQGAQDVDVARGYPLGPGDVLRIDFLGRPVLSKDIPVELNGYASFPFMDPILVSGRTISELRAELPVFLSGAVVREKVGDEFQLVALEEADVDIAVKKYRPIIASGDVNKPGEVSFSVGMTVRSAIAKALGLNFDALLFAQNISKTHGSTDPSELVVERAVLSALASQKDEIEQSDIIVPVWAVLSPQELLERAREDLTLRRAMLNAEDALHVSAVALAEDDVIDALALKEDMMRTVSVERENVQRLEGRASRAFSVYAGSLIQGRRSLLEVENYLRDATDAVEKSLFERTELLSDEKIKDLEQEQQWRARIAQIDAMLGPKANIDTTNPIMSRSVEPDVVLYRQGASGTSAEVVGMDYLLMPGDLIAVDISRSQ